MKQILVCKNCERVLSAPLEICAQSKETLASIDISSRDDLVPVGFCYKAQTSFIEMRYNYFREKTKDIKPSKIKKLISKFGYSDENRFYIENYESMKHAMAGTSELKWAPKAYMLNFTPQDWLNVEDLLNYDEDHEDEIEHGYCCGPTGFFGPNYKCQCGTHIGTICLECNAPSVFIPSSEKTKWQNVK